MSLLNDWATDYKDTWLNVRFEFLKNFRQRRLIILSAITILIPLLFYLIPVLSGSDLPETGDDFLSNIMGFVNIVIVLNAIFFGADALNSELYHKTALLLYPLPQRRTSIFLGKFVAQLITSWVMVTFYYGASAFLVYVGYGYDAIPSEIVKSLLFAYIYMSALLSISFFLSSIVRSPAQSMMLTFFLVFMLLPITSMLLGFVDVDTSFLITNYSDFLTTIFRFPASGFGPPGGSDQELFLIDGMNLSLAYTLILGGLAWYFNNKKEV